MGAVGEVRVGCSGWHYRDWVGRVYPADIPTSRWLPAYAERFDTVELNNSFYRLPEAEQFERWREQVPPGFTFSVKASRYLTHFKRLIDPAEPLDRLLSRASKLGPTLGPILYQLPPGWVPDLERFEAFLAQLPKRIPSTRRLLRHVVEFRDPRGYEPESLALLERYGVALCLHDMPGSETSGRVVGPFVYLRLHGFVAKYGGSYPESVLEDWASRLSKVRADGRDAYVYFNNDRGAHAVFNAETLNDLLRRERDPSRDPRHRARRPSPAATYSGRDADSDPNRARGRTRPHPNHDRSSGLPIRNHSGTRR
jgi:uncharacterized protein YecE (DUF72 family)